MKRNLKEVVSFLFIVILFNSCDVSDNAPKSCPVVIGVPTVAVAGPTEATVNEEITLNVSYKTSKNCGGFTGFYKQTLPNNQKIITVNVMYDACSCTDATVSTVVEAYKFKEAEAGLYILKFQKENNTYVTHNITVGEVEE